MCRIPASSFSCFSGSKLRVPALREAAVARAQRTTTAAAMSSVLHGTTTEAALERLMTVVHEGTSAARVELASALPALIDFDDEDDDAVPTIAMVEAEPSSPALVESPLSIPPVALQALVPVAHIVPVAHEGAAQELLPMQAPADLPSPGLSPAHRRAENVSWVKVVLSFANMPQKIPNHKKSVLY